MKRITKGELLVVLCALVFILSVSYSAGRSANDRKLSEARSAYQNCQQIELVKGELRGSIERGMERLPNLDYYKTHPDELAQAQKDSSEALGRFHEKDCAELPVTSEYPERQLRRK